MANYTPGRAATAVTQRSGSYSGKGMLTTELLIGFVLVGVRIVADFEVQQDGTAAGKVLHKQGQYGPLPILAGLIGSFFFLSFLAAAGGTKAKIAVILGGIIITTLGVESFSEITKIAQTLGTVGTVVVPGASGFEGSGASSQNVGSAGSSAASTAGQAASNTVQQMAGRAGITYVAPTSIANIAHDIASAAEQSLRQIIPGGTTPLPSQFLSQAGNEIKNILSKIGL